MDAISADFYTRFAQQARSVSDARFGTVVETLGYFSEGEVSDWMFGEKGIIAFSPEIGISETRANDFIIPQNVLFESFQQSINVLVLFLQMSRFQGVEATLSFDNRQQMSVLFKNSGISTIYSPILIFKSDNSFFAKSIKKVLFRKSTENLQSVNFKIESASGEIRVDLQKLTKLQSFEFVFEFSDGFKKDVAFDFEMSIFLKTGTQIWKKQFFYSQNVKFVKLYFFILFFCLFFLSSISFLLIQNNKKTKKKVANQTILMQFNVV